MAQGEAQLLMEQQERSRAALRQERRTLETFFEREFKDTLAVIPPTDESVAKWDQLLHDERLKRLEELVDLMKLWDAPKTIPEPKSFLHYARLQPVLAQMLEDIARYRTYLDRFIERFQAENECIVPKHNPQNKSDTANPSAPIHYAALQLDEDFLEWLLARSATDINLRNSFKQTALTLLCEEYVQCMRKQMQACPPGRLGKIRTVVLRLLKAKADFNICSSHMKLPFELLLKHCETHDETRLFVEQCVELVPCALAISSVNERNERVVGFYNNNPNVQVTVELLELFLRHNDRSNFTTHLAGFEIDASNVKKVIRLLLHTACDQKMADCVRLIVDRGERHIFKVLPRKPGRNAAAKEGPVAEEGANSVELSRRFGWQESIDVQKGSELEHRVELKGLLKKVCLMADLPLLQLLLAKISDLIVLNDDPLLVVTLAKAYDYKRRVEERNALLACAEFLATQETIHMSKRDNSGNTSLHLALKYGFDSVALALLRQRYTYLGMRNNDNLTPLDYGTFAFWRSYLDQCIEVDSKRSIPDRNVIRFNLQGFHSPALSMTSAVSADGTPAASDRSRNKRSSWKLIQRVDQTYCQPHKFTRTVTEMTTLRQIAQSKELKRLLVHPVVYTFIMVKWTRLCHWNYLNLLLTALTIIFFGNYSLTACSVEGPSTVLWLLSLLGVVCVAIRETLQLLFLRRSYLSFENAQDLINAVAMSVVLANGCNGLLSSFVVISFAMQLTFLLGSLQSNSLATMMYMFKTVSKNFLKSFLLFMPLIGAFIYAFHLTYNEDPEDHAQVCERDDCSEENFNNFRTFWNATIKTLVMTTGEFEAAAIDFEGGKMLLFILFMFFAPIVILNLINGLAVSDIAAIREESELISISKKVMLLEQYERGVANVYPGWLRRCFPRPFFAEYDCRIHVKTKEYRKIEVHLRELSTKAGKGTAPVNPGGAAALNNAKSRLHGSSQCSVQIPPSGKPAKQKVVGKPLPKIPWIPQGDSCNFIFDVRVFRLALFMRLDQSIVDEALAIIERQQALASIQLTVKSTPTPDTPVTPVRTLIAAKVRQPRAASVAPAGKKRSKEPTQNEEMQRELLEVKTQLKTVLELLRRKENQEKRKDKRQAKSLKRKGQRRVQKKSKKAIPEAEPMGDQ
ncbi:AGAP001011-PA [Anopheles gambiae str. PEST]|uniref:AGAP001011-PA n=1 Tax=Anopheles gambiae TaxID=7165 RepID=Q7QHY4_ANOGA|nr:AGAP001011-PA [Anopheles gambiae str. PEST]